MSSRERSDKKGGSTIARTTNAHGRENGARRDCEARVTSTRGATRGAARSSMDGENLGGARDKTRTRRENEKENAGLGDEGRHGSPLQPGVFLYGTRGSYLVRCMLPSSFANTEKRTRGLGRARESDLACDRNLGITRQRG